jgi:GMP synthase (glutamine-hydrolysing)
LRPIAICVLGTTVPNVLARRGDFADWFAAGLGGDCRVVDARSGGALPEPGEVSGIVLTGSGSMVTDRESWSERTRAWLARVAPQGVPILGVCYGHQLLADALGGRVDWNPRGREIGTIELRSAAEAARDPLFEVLPARFLAQASHSQSVVALPPGARVAVANDHDPHQGVVFAPRVFGVQFHPEFDADIARGYIEHRATDLESEGFDRDALASMLADDPAGAALLRRFAELCR